MIQFGTIFLLKRCFPRYLTEMFVCSTVSSVAEVQGIPANLNSNPFPLKSFPSHLISANSNCFSVLLGLTTEFEVNTYNQCQRMLSITNIFTWSERDQTSYILVYFFNTSTSLLQTVSLGQNGTKSHELYVCNMKTHNNPIPSCLY